MTTQETIQAMKFYKAKLYNGIFNDKIGAFDVAISALEKQIPKKAEHDDGVWSICPNCGGSVANDSEEAHNGETSYCDHCGQAIDWSDKNG